MSLFASTAGYYGAYRSNVPPAVAEILAAAAPTAPPNGPRRLVDVGTGTGFVIRALMPFFDEAIGVDPDAELLAVASDDLAPFVTSNRVRLVEGRAEDFTVPAGWAPQLVTVCRAFHWFDRPRFLARARAVLEPGGMVAVFGDRSVWAANAAWKTATLDVVREFLGDERRAGAGAYRAPTEDYADDLRSAGLRDVRRQLVPVRRTRTVDSVIGYLHSSSFASHAVLGDRVDAFDERLRERLTPMVDADGALVDENRFDVLTATV